MEILLGPRVHVTSFLITYYWVRFFNACSSGKIIKGIATAYCYFQEKNGFTISMWVGLQYTSIDTFLFFFFLNNGRIFLWQSLHVIMTLHDTFLEPKLELWRVSWCAGAMTWIQLLWSFWNVIQKTSCNNSTTLWLLNQEENHI